MHLKEVSFTEALTALREGKTVHWISATERKDLRYEHSWYNQKSNLTFKQLLEGDWAIESVPH